MRRKFILLSTLILIASFAIGAELQSFYKARFAGLNTSVNVKLLQDDEAYGLSNFTLDEIGSIKERGLFGQYNSSPGALGNNFITGLFKHYTVTSKYFIACAGSKVGLGSAGTFSDISPTTNTVIAGTFWSGVSFNNKFYMFNPSLPMQIYDGIKNAIYAPGASSYYPSTNCSYSAIHKSRVWAARSDSFPYRLYYSSLSNGEDWTTTGGYVDLPDINQEITGIISWGGYLYIFTETNIYVLLGSTPNDFSLRKTNSTVGAIAPLSIKITDIGICFLARSGVYAFDGNNSNKISIKIESTISGISKTLINNSCAIYDGKRYWLSYIPQGSNYNNKIMIYDILLKDWYIYQGEACNISYFERAYGGSDKGELYGGSSISNGIIYQFQSTTGTESVTHSTESDFDAQITHNTVVTTTPSVELYNNGIDDFTKLLIHFDGVDAATAYIAETGQDITFAGTAQLDTAQKRYGSSSLLLDGNSDYIQLADSDDWDFGTGDFTLDMWIRFNVLQNSYLIDVGRGASQNKGATIVWEAANQFSVYLQTGIYTFAWTPSADTWYHVALSRSGTSLRMFIDGTQIGTTKTSSDNIDAFNYGLIVGSNAGTSSYVNGWVDEVRVSKGIARYTSDFNVSNTAYERVTGGTLTSQNIQINAADSSSLDIIDWVGTYSSNTKISFQTRTGATNDTVFFNGWETWTSSSTVDFDTVSTSSVGWTSSDNTNFPIYNPSSPQTRDILYYETDDKTSPNCVQFSPSGAGAFNAYAQKLIPVKDLSSVKWITGWFKSPESGPSIELSMGENDYLENIITFNTVMPNTWERWYWYIGDISSSARDNINKIRVIYKGTTAGNVIMGESWAQNYYESGDTISSNPNDWIQYRGIFGTDDTDDTPLLSSITLSYVAALTISESSLSSYYYTKWFDFKTPQLNKQFDSLILESNSTTSSSCTLYCDYDIDFGTKTGTLSYPIRSTANTVRLLKNFPSSTYGKAMRLKIYNTDKDATVTIKGVEIRYRQEPVTPD